MEKLFAKLEFSYQCPKNIFRSPFKIENPQERLKLSKYLIQNSNPTQNIFHIFKSLFEPYETLKVEDLSEIKSRFAEVRINLFEVQIFKVLVRHNETINLLFEDDSFSVQNLKLMTFKQMLTQIDPSLLEFYDLFLKEFPYIKEPKSLKAKFDEIIKNSLSKTQKKHSLPIKEETPKNMAEVKKMDDFEEVKKNENKDDSFDEDLKKLKQDEKEHEEYYFEPEEMDGIFIFRFACFVIKLKR